MFKKFTGLLLAMALLAGMLVFPGSTASAETTAESTRQFAQSTVRGSAVLHCFNWSYKAITENLADIRAAGYTAVQTSPVQAPKDYNSYWTDLNGQWWKMYQPIGLSVADGNTWLGTKAELKTLCDTAEEYGIKVIVDIVANHLANNGSDGGTYSYLNSGVESDLKNSSYYHTNNIWINDDSRYNMTQYHIGMPDLNTSNSYIQKKALSLLKECADLGVDGFRFDAAKHIELPTDSGCASDFWPTVINGVNSYKSGLFSYGEILGGAGTEISNYTKYMDITDNYTGEKVLDKVYYNAPTEAADITYYKGAGASHSVLWVESHDTYMGETGSSAFKNTSAISSDILTRAWAVIASRADSTALYFARPNSTMGKASSDTNWKSTAVAEVNKFKNFFDGTEEYLSSSSSNYCVYNERSTSGVVISKLNGGGTVSLTAHKMADGTYTDQVSGNTFTVSGGKIRGTVGSTGVAVVYNPEDDSALNPLKNTYLLGDFNSWSESDSSKMNADSDTVLSKTITLSKGTYAFKIKMFDTWYGNDGTITDTTTTTSTHGWEFSEAADDCTLDATGGKYTFTLDTSTMKLIITREETPTEATTKAPGISYYVVGSFNGWSNSTAISDGYSVNLKAGTYTFKIKDSNGNWYGNGGKISDTTTTTSTHGWQFTSSAGNCTLVATGGVYTFTLNTSTMKVIVTHSQETVEPHEVSYYLVGDFNNWSNSSEIGDGYTIHLDKGSYLFKIIDSDGNWYGNDGTIADTTTTTSTHGWQFTPEAGDCTLTASGGSYTFTFNTETMKLIVTYAEDVTEHDYTVNFVYKYHVFDTSQGLEYADGRESSALNTYTATSTLTSAELDDANYVNSLAKQNTPDILSNYYNYSFPESDEDYVVSDAVNGVVNVTVTLENSPREYTVYLLSGEKNGSIVKTKTCHYNESVTFDASSDGECEAEFEDGFIWHYGKKNYNPTSDTVLSVKKSFSFKVFSEKTYLFVEKNEDYADELTSKKPASNIAHAYSEYVYENNQKMLEQNFYIQDIISSSDKDAGKFIGSGVVYYLWDDDADAPNAAALKALDDVGKDYVLAQLNAQKDALADAENEKTILSGFNNVKGLICNHYKKPDGEADASGLLRYSSSNEYYNFILGLRISANVAYAKYSYRVYSYMIYQNDNGENTVVISPTCAEAKLF